MEKQTFPSCWSKDKAARRAERTIFTILYIFGREGWVILVFRFHFDQNSVDVLGSLPADVLWGSFVTHLLNAWRTNPKGPLRGGYVLGRRNWKVMSISVSSLATKESRIISQLPVTLKRVFFFSWNRRLRFEEDLRINISESDGETNTPSLVCNSSAFAAVLKRILWQLFLLVAVHPWFSNELF